MKIRLIQRTKCWQEEIFNYNISKGFDANKKYMYQFDEIKYDKKYEIDTLNLYQSNDSIIYNSKSLVNFNFKF